MYISRSYNKKMNVWYAYEVEYVWDEMKQKKVQKRKCIGQIDPDSDRIIPNGKRGPARSVPGTLGTTETGSPTSGPVSARQTHSKWQFFPGICCRLSRRIRNGKRERTAVPERSRSVQA